MRSISNLFQAVWFSQSALATAHTLINIVERTRKSLDKDFFACCVFVDLQKAFDTVDHEILLEDR